MNKFKLAIGDIIEINTSKGYAYAQITHKHHEFGTLIRVLPGMHSQQIPKENLGEMANARELYFTFLFNDEFYESSCLKIVGRVSVPPRCSQFPLMRDGIANPATKQVDTWWLWDGVNEWPVGKLNDIQRHLSLRRIWTCNILIDRIIEGWTPLNEL